MKVHAIFGMLLLLLCFGCIFPPKSTSIPSDLEIVYSYGACHAEWGRTTIEIDAQGNGVHESTRGEQVEFRKTFTINEEKLLGLLNRIEESGFYTLGEQYSDPLVMDGSCEYVSITKDNSTKIVYVSNTQAPGPYQIVTGEISAIVEEN